MIADLTSWTIDQSKSTITFKVEPLIFSAVEGYFRSWNAAIHTHENDFSSIEIDLRIDSGSITTGDIERDEHLKSPDFFDIEKYPQILFKSTSVEMEADTAARHKLKGDLTIKGITKPVQAEVQYDGIIKDASGNENALFTIEAKVNRKDWGLLWNETEEETSGGPIESEEVMINSKIVLTKGGHEFIG